MHRSRPYIIGLLIFAFSLLTACTNADRKKGEEGSASFTVRSVKGDGYTLQYDVEGKNGKKIAASAWHVPREIDFTFRACLEERGSTSKISGHRFDVENPITRVGVAQAKGTDIEGCFTWSETMPYNYFVGSSKWIVLEREIIGTGVHTGRQKVRIAVNPWAVGESPRDKGDSVLFLRDHPLHPTLLVEPNEGIKALSGDILGEDQLFIDDVEIQSIRQGEKSDGMYLRLNIAMEPKVVFSDYRGNPQYKSLKTGDFYVIGHLVLNGTGEQFKDRVILTSSSELPKDLYKKGENGVYGEGKVIDGKLIARLNAWIDPRMPQGNLELVIKVVPKIRGLRAYQGIYELGSQRNLSASIRGRLREDCRENGPCDTAAYLKTASNFKQRWQEAQKRFGKYAGTNSPYLFHNAKLRFVQVEPGETTTQRSVAYSVSTCLTDAFTGERPVGLPFEIRYQDTGEVIKTETKEDGCLNWPSSIKHNYYKPEEFIEKNVTISKASGFKRDLKLWINPWDDKFTFGFDHREFTDEFWQKQRDRNKIPSRFFLASFGYHTVRFQYNIDNLMNLEVRKTVLMELYPKVLRYSGIINARKMTEPLRDGIWLMKVAIQKNYLDPAQTGVFIDGLKEAHHHYIMLQEEDKGASEDLTSKRLHNLGIKAPPKEFITTETALVRSTDGVVIQPVELTMQDLRLMRVRSNFLVQLQPVDERQLQVQNAVHRGMSQTIDELMAERKAKNERLGRNAEDEDLDAAFAKEQEDIKAKVADRKVLARDLYREIGRQLRDTGNYAISFAERKLSDDQLGFLSDILEELDLKLRANDFTNIKLPSCRDLNCDSFVEPWEQSGLKGRTFVGPVIFLSNAYRDSVRATDNIDEAACGLKVEYTDELEKELIKEQKKIFSETEEEIDKQRYNTLYDYSEYFGSLRHLCNADVDTLIAKEKEQRAVYEMNMPATSSVYNYAKAYAMDFLSLRDEMPQYVEFTAAQFESCGLDLTKCMREVNEFRVPVAKALSWIDENLDYSQPRFEWIRSWFRDNPEPVKMAAWNSEDLRRALFDPANLSERRFASCALLAGKVREMVVQAGHSKIEVSLASERAIRECVQSSSDPIFFDRKLRVSETAQSGDPYVFLGGYQLNLNVGQSFSVSRSDSFSWSFGVEAADFVGMLNKGAGALTKPLSLKGSYSNSFSNSDGTNITDSTYLVAQIAKFKVQIDKYERCVVLKYRPAMFERLIRAQYVSALAAGGYQAVKWAETLRPMRALLVCEGQINHQPRKVDEHYFYFTQHFTEGDMLDQADLYNHPWLLALRGWRDFASFLHVTRAQEVVNLGNFVKGLFGSETREIEWPLGQLRGTFDQIVPSFPGFYTELDAGEGGLLFPLEGRLSMFDEDINNEVISRKRKAEMEKGEFKGPY